MENKKTKSKKKKTTTPAKKKTSSKKKTTTKKTPSKTTTQKKVEAVQKPTTQTKKKAATTTQKKKTTTNTTKQTKPKTTTQSKVKIVPKTSLDKEITAKTSEPIKIITSTEKRKGKEKEKVSKKQTFLTILQSFKPRKKLWIFLFLVFLFFLVFFLFPSGESYYLSGASNKNLEAPKFMKLKEECCAYNATFSSPRSLRSLKKDMEKILDQYEVLQCDNNTYYYNKQENYTVVNYSLKNGLFLNQLSLTYSVGNSCDIDTKFKRLELLPSTFSLEDAIKDGNYVLDGDKVHNIDAYTNFMDQINQKKESTLRIVKTNEQQEIIITDVSYKDGKYIVSYDATRTNDDKNNKSIVAYKFDHLTVSDGKLYAFNGSKLKIKDAKKYETYYLIDVE